MWAILGNARREPWQIWRRRQRTIYDLHIPETCVRIPLSPALPNLISIDERPCVWNWVSASRRSGGPDTAFGTLLPITPGRRHLPSHARSGKLQIVNWAPGHRLARFSSAPADPPTTAGARPFE